MSQPQCSATTAKGEQCQRRAMTGSDRCAAHLGLIGRKTALTDEIADNLVRMLRAGNYLHVALAAVGVPGATYRDWIRRGRSSAIADAPFHELRERVSKARAEGEARNVAVIAKAAQDGDWRAALALLEREFPDRWGPVSVRTRDVEVIPAEPIVERDPDDPFNEVDELAERRRTRTAG